MLTQLQNAERVNSVWDVYMEDSLKDDNKTTFTFLSHHKEIKISIASHQVVSHVSSIPSPSMRHHVS